MADTHDWKSEPDDTNLASARCHLHHSQTSHEAPLAMLPAVPVTQYHDIKSAICYDILQTSPLEASQEFWQILEMLMLKAFWYASSHNKPTKGCRSLLQFDLHSSANNFSEEK